MQEVTTCMREKGINIEWIHREEWRKDNKTLGTERCGKIDTLHINEIIIIIIIITITLFKAKSI